jgi:hypothetical protein
MITDTYKQEARLRGGESSKKPRRTGFAGL